MTLEQRIYTHVLYIKKAVGWNNWPYLELPRLGLRKDTEFQGEQFFRLLLREKGSTKLKNVGIFAGVVTENPSPHVPLINDLHNAHLVYWWAKRVGRKNYTRCDFNQLLDEDDQTKKEWAELSFRAIERAIQTIQEKLNGMSLETLLPSIVVHGLTGHATKEERMTGQTNRGAQSSPDGHMNIYYLGKSNTITAHTKTPDEPIPNRVKTKQIGAVDSLIFDALGQSVADWLNARHRNIYILARRDHTTDKNRLSFHDGINCVYREPVDIKNALLDLLAVQTTLRDMYMLARNLNYLYYQVKGDKSAEEKFLTDAATHLSRLYNGTIVKNMLALICYFKPTRAQLEQLIQGSILNTSNHEYLNKLLTRYIHLESILTDEQKRANFVAQYASRHHIDQESAEIMAEYWYDMVRDYKNEGAWKKIEFIFTKYYSSSYKLDLVYTKNGTRVKSFSIAPRFATHRGGAEDILGLPVFRQENR